MILAFKVLWISFWYLVYSYGLKVMIDDMLPRLKITYLNCLSIFGVVFMIVSFSKMILDLAS